uniref:Selenoprotein O n=1 Tax=Denticeps clupeoides TaxID=299321 RepID=A0AAY4AV29_9TELE
MDLMGSGLAPSPLERLPFDNVALRRLPLDASTESGSRTVRAACFSRVSPQPLLRPALVALSASALALLGLRAEEVRRDPRGPEYLSGSRPMPGSEPAAHCYCGHQFGLFAGQLGDGAVCYLGEVRAGDAAPESPCGRWEIQLKGAGLTPYSRQSDGRKVLRSSIREFLCSEAMFALGVPTTRAGSLVTSDSCVVRDAFYAGRPCPEKCSVVLRIAPSFIRFGSFEIFHPVDDYTGRQGPSVGRHDIRAQLLDYVIETFYPDIQKGHSDRQARNTAFFREVTVRTARLVALWQCVGFCHGVLNTDNMSILGLTIDYGPFGFMDSRYDPEYACNASDKKRRYTYEAQPYVCRWNLVRLAEALGSELVGSQAGAILDEYMSIYEGFYLANMRRKLGLLQLEEPEDHQLVADLLQIMHNTGADFTNTFRLLSNVPWPRGDDTATDILETLVEQLLEQCASLDELKVANHPSMAPRELEMILSMSETNPGIFNVVANQPEVTKQLEKLGRLKELLEISPDELRAKQRDDWFRWIRCYRRRLARECVEGSDSCALEKERIRVMDSTNPRVVLRNYIAQNAIEAAESGDFSEVQQVLKLLEKPYTAQPELEQPHLSKADGVCGQRGPDASDENGKAMATHWVTYDSKPPAWAREIHVT